MAKRKTPVSVWAATRTADPSVGGAAVTGPVAKASTKQLRRWSRTNPWLRAIINMRRRQVAMARYVIVPDAGHSALEPGIRAALVNATESFRLSMSEDDLFAPRFPWET